MNSLYFDGVKTNFRRKYAHKLGLSNLSKFVCILMLIVILITGSAFYQGDTTLTTPTTRTLLKVIVTMCIFAILVYRLFQLQKNTLEKKDFTLIVIIIIYWFFILVDSFVFDLRLSVLYLITFVLLDQKEKRLCFWIFRKSMIVIAFLGIIFYLLFTLKIPVPYSIYDYYLESSEGSYVRYLFILIYKSNISSNFTLRLCGIFNEPGLFGTYLAFLICADKANFKKKDNIILLLAGLLTFSLAFVVFIILYFSVLSLRKPKMFILIIVIFAIVIFVLPIIRFTNANINNLISRLSINYLLSGNNRSNPVLDNLFENAIRTGHFFFGYGGGFVNSLDIPNISSFKIILIDYGIVGFFIIYVPLFVSFYLRSRKDIFAIAFLTCLILNVYQRPYVYLLAFIVIAVGGIEYMNSSIWGREN